MNEETEPPKGGWLSLLDRHINLPTIGVLLFYGAVGLMAWQAIRDKVDNHETRLISLEQSDKQQQAVFAQVQETLGRIDERLLALQRLLEQRGK